MGGSDSLLSSRFSEHWIQEMPPSLNDLQLRVYSTTCIIVYTATKLETNNIKILM